MTLLLALRLVHASVLLTWKGEACTSPTLHLGVRLVHVTLLLTPADPWHLVGRDRVVRVTLTPGHEEPVVQLHLALPLRGRVVQVRELSRQLA